MFHRYTRLVPHGWPVNWGRSAGDDRREIAQDVSGQESGRGRRPAIGERLGQGQVPQRAAITHVHAARGRYSIPALKEDRHPLARKGIKGVRDDQRIKAATVRGGGMTGRRNPERALADAARFRIITRLTGCGV